MAKSNIPAVGPAVSGQTGTNLIAGSSICDMIRSACPMLENIYCNEDPINGSKQIIAVNSCGDQKIVCSIISEKGMTDDDVCKIVEEKTQKFLVEESICALIDGKINPFLTESQVCQLIASKSFNAESICAEIAERCPHVKEVNIFGKTLSVSFTNNAREVENFDIPCSSSTNNDDGTTTTVHPDGSEHTSVDSPVRSVTGPGVDVADPANVFVGESTFSFDESTGDVLHVSAGGAEVSGNICAAVVASCNSTVTATEGGGFIHVDNAGKKTPVEGYSLSDCEGDEIESGARVLVAGNVTEDADYARANQGRCTPEEGTIIGKAADGTLRGQPPLKCGISNTAVPAVNVSGPAITAIIGETLAEPCAEIENTSCYLAQVRAYLRTSVGFRMARSIRQDWIVRSVGSREGGGGNWAGSMTVQREACNNNNCDTDSIVPAFEIFAGNVSAGQSIEVCQNLVFSPNAYTESEFNLLRIGPTVVSIDLTSCQERM